MTPPDPTPLNASPPDAAILVNGEPLPQEAWKKLLEISVQEHIEGLSAFTLRFSAVQDARLDFELLDGSLFNMGGEIEIQLGYSGALRTLLYGDIIGIDLNLGEGDAPSFVVRGYDKRYRMRRGNKTRPFAKMKDSDIAAQIAQEYKLSAEVVDSRIKHDHVSQNHKSDLEFLTRRAEPIGYEVMIVGKTLYFRPRNHEAKPSLTLQVKRDLLDFSAQLSINEQVSAVIVRGWDPKRMEPIVGKASKRERTSMGSVSGPEAAHQGFGDATLTLADPTITGQEEADLRARQRLEQLALGFLQSDGRCPGRTDLRAGMVIELQEAGKRFSGAYYVTSATHAYAPQRGYTTSFSARRNAT